MYSTKEAAEKLGLSQDHIRLLARKGKIKARRLGHDWVILDLDYTRRRKPKHTFRPQFSQANPSSTVTAVAEIGTLKKKAKNQEHDYPSYAMKLLRQFRIFDEVSEAELAPLADKVVVHHFHKGQVLAREGDKATSFYLIGKGMIRVAKITPGGKQVTIAMRYGGEFFGLMPAIKGIPHFATTIAIGDTDVLAIRRKDFLDFGARNPSIWFKMLEMEVKRLNDIYNRFVNIISESASQRVSQVLIALCSRYGNTLHFTHQEIADMTGVTLETTTRILTQLKKAGMIALARGTIDISDPQKLLPE